MSDFWPAGERRRLTLLGLHKRSRNRDPKPDIFSALPAEIRQQIYSYYFANSMIRYHRRTHFHHGKPTKRAYCHGPPGIALLLTSRTIYHEALPVLMCSLTLLIDRTEAFNALRTISKHTQPESTRHNHTEHPFPPLLANLTRAIRHLILSKINCQGPYDQIEPLSSPKPFPRLCTTTLFGVYPYLAGFLDYGDTVLLGHWGQTRRWYWPVPWQPEVDLNAAARRLHEVLGRDAAQMPVDLRAWCQGCATLDWRITLLLVRADLDDSARGYHWDALAWRNIYGSRRRQRAVAAPGRPARLGKNWKQFERETAMRWRRIVEEEKNQIEEEKKQAEEEAGEEEEEGDGDGDEVTPARQPTSGWSPRCDPTTRWMDDDWDFFWPPQEAGAEAHGDDDDIDALVSRLPPPSAQKQEPIPQRLDNTATAATASSSQLAGLPEKDVDHWATITDTGDWQSVRSGEVAFRQWDAALDLSLAAGARW